MRFDLYEAGDDGEAPTLTWDSGQLSGRPDALAAFHDAVTVGEPVVLAEPSDPMPPGSETWEQFLATAYALPFTWDDVAGDNEALDALTEWGTAPEGAVN